VHKSAGFPGLVTYADLERYLKYFEMIFGLYVVDNIGNVYIVRHWLYGNQKASINQSYLLTLDQREDGMSSGFSSTNIIVTDSKQFVARRSRRD